MNDPTAAETEHQRAPNSGGILIIGQSARQAAEMAAGAGLTPLVIDCFGDDDTRRLALDYRQVKDLSRAELIPAVADLRRRHALDGIVYASGFELHSHSLDYLAEQAPLLGNPPSLFRRVQHKAEFLRRLQDLQIPHPRTRFTAPETENGWLFKPLLGCGGKGIRRFRSAESTSETGYWQQYLSGEAMSVTFIAAGRKIRILGVNRQWSQPQVNQPFRFAGIASQAELPSSQLDHIARWLQCLLDEYHLQGLGSLDFILHQGQCYVLELNPRLPASAQFYGDQVFAWHLQACRHGLLPHSAPRAPAAAYEVIYADQTLTIPRHIEWPDWARDRPRTGAIISRDLPICSIIAAAESPALAEKLLRQRRRALEQLLNLKVVKHHGIPGQC